jgi:hypothetical protein
MPNTEAKTLISGDGGRRLEEGGKASIARLRASVDAHRPNRKHAPAHAFHEWRKNEWRRPGYCADAITDRHVFDQARRPANMLRAGLYARAAGSDYAKRVRAPADFGHREAITPRNRRDGRAGTRVA